MTLKYSIGIQEMYHKIYDHFSLSLPKDAVMVSALIIDDGELSGHRRLYEFASQIINNENVKDEYWTEGYVAKVVGK